MSTPREPLDAEERELARRLARDGVVHEPGPALDARILAAARAAVGDQAPGSPPLAAGSSSAPPAGESAGPAQRRGRRFERRHWMLGFGVAASLLLAVTVAWQLRPQRTTQFVYESAEAPAAPQPVADLPGPAAATSPAKAPGPLQLDPPLAAGRRAPAPGSPARPVQIELRPPPPMPVPPPRVARLGDVAPPPAQAPTREAAAPVRQAEPARAARRAGPPAPAAPAPMAEVGANRDPNAAGKGSAEPVDAAGAAASVAAAQPPGERDAAAAAPAESEAGASALRAAVAKDSRLPPKAWLRRIRRHRFEGNSALAIASMQAFRRAHPDRAIPEDLRPLLP
jgi:hypothetical protein